MAIDTEFFRSAAANGIAITDRALLEFCEEIERLQAELKKTGQERDEAVGVLASFVWLIDQGTMPVVLSHEREVAAPGLLKIEELEKKANE